MSGDAPQRSGGYRFQIKRDRDGGHRWYVFNASGTMVGRHPEGFATELEARLDAEQLREQVASAPINGELGEGAPRPNAVSDDAAGRRTPSIHRKRRSKMASIVSTTHMPPLGAHERREIGLELQATLVELVDLSLVGKQLHWSVVGPTFRTLHQQLDELVDSWRDLGDTVAERAVAIGFWPDGQAEAIAAGSELAGVEAGAIKDDAVVRELARRLAKTSERTRGRMDRRAALDAASQDVLIEVVRALEQQLWMVRAQLEEGDE